MLYPKGQAVYENLNTSFTQLDAMMSELKSIQFTGYVQLTGWEYEGILLMDTGNLLNAIEESKGQCRFGPSAAEGVAAKGREKDGAISVYRLAPEMTQLLANLFNCEPLYKDLSNDLTTLDKLVAKMQGEKLTGYIQVKMLKSQNAGTIYMREGIVLDSAFNNRGNLLSGKVMEQIIQAAATEPSTFTVYRADLAAVYGNQLNLVDSFARQGMLTFWQDVLQTMEKTVDGASKAGLFLTTFKRTCIDCATAYDFLDPFAAEFEYKDGHIKFDGQATVATFNEGLSRVLELTVDNLKSQVGITDIVQRLEPAAAALIEKHNGKIEQVGLAETLPELFRA
jgi:hypothetical protein